jgi:putative aldouronate transport system substrate-binding protein
MKKMVLLLMVLLCSTMSYANGKGDSGSSAAQVKVTPPGSFPVVNEKVTLNVFAAVPAWVEDMNTNWTTLHYEEKTNVHISWDVISIEGKDEKINLLLSASADLPDVIIPNGMSNEQLVRYGTQGIFIPLNDLIDEQMVYLKNMFAYDETVLKQITATDGNVYGLPSYNECYHCSYSAKFWINQSWLDRLGMEIPTTTDELYNVLSAFKEEDANGNGESGDEIPLAGSLGWHGSVDEYIMTSFIYSDGTYLRLDKNNNVASVADQDAFKEGLKYLRKLYQDGLLDKESFTMDGNQIKALTGNPNGNMLGSSPAGHPGVFLDLSQDVRDEFVSLPPLTGPTGIKQSIKYPVGALTGQFMITEDCSMPEVAIRWADGFYTDVTDWRGEPGVDWRPAKEGELGLNDKPALYYQISKYGEPQNKLWAYFNPEFQATYWRDSMAVVQGVYNLEKVLYDATKIIMFPMLPRR